MRWLGDPAGEIGIYVNADLIDAAQTVTWADVLGVHRAAAAGRRMHLASGNPEASPLSLTGLHHMSVAALLIIMHVCTRFPALEARYA